jgi:hypothetical protein
MLQSIPFHNVLLKGKRWDYKKLKFGHDFIESFDVIETWKRSSHEKLISISEKIKLNAYAISPLKEKEFEHGLKNANKIFKKSLLHVAPRLRRNLWIK